MEPFDEFTKRLHLLASKYPSLIINTLSNVFTMRLIGNKTHGDLAEIAIAEFVNQFMYDYEARHVGKDLFRAKSSEEDILVTSLISESNIPISLKAYGDGPLQLSTDKDSTLFPLLESFGVEEISDQGQIKEILALAPFRHAGSIHVLPLVYNEKKQECAIMLFSPDAIHSTCRIYKSLPGVGRRKHPVWIFEDKRGNYICEVRYGGKNANALQRGLWTHTQKASSHFSFVTDGWISYSHNLVLTELFAKALNATAEGHSLALKAIESDIEDIKKSVGLA